MNARCFRFKSMHAIGLVLLLAATSGLAQDCKCDFTISLAGTEWYFDGVEKGVKPGDHICFASGNRGSILLRNIHGTSANPVVIKNKCDGKTVFTAPGNLGNNIEVRNSSFLRFTGGNNPNEEYGLQITGAVMGLNFFELSTDIEADHVWVHDVGCCGIVAKTDPTCDPATWRGNFTMRNLYFHHNKIENTGCEGFYVGNSHYAQGVTKTCNGQNITVYEHDLYNVEISYNTLSNIGQDGIQFSSILENCVVHHNTVYNYGTRNNYGHTNGIQSGGGCSSLVYNNICNTGVGQAFYDAGRGNGQYYNNIAVNCANGFLLTQNQPYIRSGYILANNLVINPREYAIWMFQGNTDRNLVINNILIAPPSSTKYINKEFSNIPLTELNNITTKDITTLKFTDYANNDFHPQIGSPAIDTGLDIKKSYGVDLSFDYDDLPRPEKVSGKWDIGPHEYKPKGPTSNAGPDINITLPTNTTNINGTGTSSSGVLGYTWTKKSGGTATLTNANTSNLTVQDLVEGVYVFELEVIDADGSAFDEVVVTVFPLGFNQSPTANAGPDKTITLPTNSTTLNGIGTDPDGTVITYTWSKISGPTVTMTNENTANLSLTNLLEGTYVFQLLVTDEDGATATATTRITVNPQAANQLPITNAGADKTIYLPTNQIVLTATASDPDGTIVTILWEKRSGPAAALANQNTLTLTASNLVLGNYVFRITVTDNRGGSKFDEVNVAVLQANQSPVANAGVDRTITLPTSTIVLNGQGTDADGSITTYLWTKVSGPAGTNLVNANTSTLTVNGLSQGVHVFGLTVTDNNGATGYDQVQVRVNAAPINIPPSVNAGADKTITLPTSTLTLNGTASDSDGSVSTLAWTKKTGPSVVLTNENTLNLSLSNLVAGQYTFTLTATDNVGAKSSDDVVVNVLPNTVNQSPLANAGTNQFVTLPTNTTTLTGIGSDPDGTISQVLWNKVTGPSVTLSGTTTNSLTLNNLVEGEYVFQFTVTDNLGATGSDQVSVSVGASNVNPIVTAGADKVVTLPTNSVDISATASDPDGTIQSYTWIQLSGGGSTLSGQTTATLSASNLVAGIYEFQITVTDNTGAPASDIVTVYVKTPDNQLPIVSAEGDKIVYLPTNTVVLNGSAVDLDGTIASLQWSQISGPAVVLSNETSLSLTALNLLEGNYVFRLTAEDNLNGIAYSEARLTVYSSTTNQPPVANAGGNQILKLPTNTITLIGTGIDPDGTISSYNWQKVSGPNVTLSTPNSSSLKLTGLVEGIYTFRLTVTDNNGASAIGLATVTVIPQSVNQNPLANAGQSQYITLPTNSTDLVGSGFDPDGTIQSYSWSKLSGPGGGTIVTPGSQLTSVTGLVEGTYTFRLTITDNLGATGYDDVIAYVSSSSANKIPAADAGGSKSIFLPTSTINLFGSGFDPDGTIVSYAWTKISGGTVTLSNADKPTSTLSNLQEGVYVFQLTVTDDDGASGADLATVVVKNISTNIEPIVFAGGNKITKLPQNSITIVGSASDLDGQIAKYSWTQESGPSAKLGPPTNAAIVNISLLSEGTYRFRLTVEDNLGSSAFDEMTLQVIPSTANVSPNVNAGNDAAVYLPDNSFTLSGSATDDGTIVSTIWTKLSGPTATINDPTSLITSIGSLIEGIYVFRLTGVDDNNTSSSDDITITVFPPGVNKLPIVDAGQDQEIILPTSTATLNGSASDPDGTITSTIWSLVSGGSFSMTGENTLTLELSNLTVGTHVFKLTATDNEGTSSSDNIQIIVLPVPPNKPPVVTVISSQVLTLPINETELIGTSNDTDGTVVSVAWTQKSGPNTPTLENSNTLHLSVSDLVQGTYIFRLSATDNDGAVGFRDAIVIVSPNTTDKQGPVAYTGDDLVLVLPENEVSVTGYGVDPDGFIENYIWEQTGGIQANFSFSDNLLSVTNLEVGIYSFRLTVTDSDALTASDEITISVIESENEIPLFFSPNNDGFGDYWQFRNIESYEQCSLVVFTRAGLEVFEARSYQNDWDGTHNGKILSDGDYYYVINCDDGRQLKGAVRIIK